MVEKIVGRGSKNLSPLTVPPVIVDLMDIHHGSAAGQEVVCTVGGSPTPDVDWYICKNIKQ